MKSFDKCLSILEKKIEDDNSRIKHALEVLESIETVPRVWEIEFKENRENESFRKIHLFGTKSQVRNYISNYPDARCLSVDPISNSFCLDLTR